MAGDITRLFSGLDDRVARLRRAMGVAAWLESEGIAKGEAAEETALSLAEPSLMRQDITVLLDGGEASQALRDAAVSIASTASLEPGERAADNYWHGHGQRGCRIGEVVND